MAIDRVGTFATTQFLLAQIQKGEVALDNSNQQVSSGKVSDTYSGYGDQTAAMEGARSVAAHADADYAAAQQASSRLDLQDTQLSQLSNIAGQLRQDLTNAAAQQDTTGLMDQVSGLFDQAVGILNSTDGNGYIYGGDNNQTPPVTVTSLSDLAALPSVASAFANGTVKTSVRIGSNQTVQVGMLASDLGTQLFTLFQQVAQFDAGANGPFPSGATNAAQQSFLESTLPSAANAASDVNSQTAANGIRYQSVQNSMTQLQATSNVYKTFVSNIEDVDMPTALAKLSQNQIALQASYQVTSQINKLSLLNYLQPG
jgi:flagellar hook-associated protein 3 FlgL